MRECINRAMYKLEFLGWHKDSVKGIGASLWSPNVSLASN